MAKKETIVEKSVKNSPSLENKLSNEGVSSTNKQQSLKFNSNEELLQKRILDRNKTESTEDSKSFSELAKEMKSLREPIVEMAKELKERRKRIESTEDKNDRTNKNNSSELSEDERKTLLKKLDKLTQEEKESKEITYAKVYDKVTSITKSLEGRGNFGGRVSYGLTLTAESISPAFGKAMQFAISSGLGKTLWGILGPNKEKLKKEKAEEDRHKEVKELLEQLSGDTKQLSESTVRLFNLQSSSKEPASKKEARERKEEERAQSISNSTKRLFGIQTKNSELLSKLSSSISSVIKGFKVFFGTAGLALLVALFHDKFRETVKGYLLRWWSGEGGIANFITKSFALMINSTVKLVTTPFSWLMNAVQGLGKAINSSVRLVKKAFNSIPSKVSGLFSSLKSTVGSSIAKMLSPLNTIWSSIKNFFLDIVNKLKKGLSSIPLIGKAFKESGENVVQEGVEKIGQTVAKEGIEEVGEKAGSKVLKSVLKGMWGATKAVAKKMTVGSIVSTVSAVKRASEGDFAGAGLDLLSAGATLVPVVGTAASLAIDGVSLYRDMNRSTEAIEVNKDNNVKAVEILDAEKKDSTPVVVEKKVEVKVITPKAKETINTTGNLPTSKNVNTALMESQKVQKQEVVEKASTAEQQQQGIAVVNTIPSSPATRPSIG